MPQLDGLRAFAVTAVLVHHFLNLEQVPWRLARLPWGHLGVRLFFVLSGFLITGILLRYRDDVDELRAMKGTCVTRFYFRRFLRIFPVYYLVLALAVLAHVPPTRQMFASLVTYTVNFKVALAGTWPPQVGHLWTLAVEEQFYLVWPWLVLFAPRRLLKSFVIGIISLGPLYRAFAVINGINPVATYSIPFASMDTLGMGALIAIVSAERTKASVDRLINFVLLPVGVIGAAVLHVWCIYNPRPNTIAFDLFLSMVFGWVIYRASYGFAGVAGKVLTSSPLTYLGRISYGVYLFHFFLPYYVWPWLNRHGFGGLQWQVLSFTLCGGGAIAIASLSWRFFEKPIMQFKDATVRQSALQPVVASDNAVGETP
jgi:peptidoglycan/LPS O-acetylase OafA/YrhL